MFHIAFSTTSYVCCILSLVTPGLIHSILDCVAKLNAFVCRTNVCCTHFLVYREGPAFKVKQTRFTNEKHLPKQTHQILVRLTGEIDCESRRSRRCFSKAIYKKQQMPCTN